MLRKNRNVAIYDLRTYKGMHKNCSQTMAFEWKYSKVAKRLKHLNYKLLYDIENHAQYKNETAKQLAQQPTPTNIQR